MRGRMILTLTLLITLPATLLGAGSEKRKDPSAAPEVQDIVFYGAKRPVLMRFHIYVDGEPFSLRWKTYVKELFTYADRNKDGFLDEKEAEIVPEASQMTRMVSTGYISFTYNRQGLNRPSMDTDRDDKVTLEELVRYYEKANIRPLILAPAYNYGSQTALTQALFKYLDLDDDNALTAKELAQAEKLLARLDVNEDEMLVSTEIASQQQLLRNRGQIRVRQVGGGGMMAPGMSRPGVNGSPFFLVPKEKSANSLTQRLTLAKAIVAHYDKDKSKRLTRGEIDLPEKMFKRLDGNKNNVLDHAELLRWIILSPDVELAVHLGKRKPKQPAVELYLPKLKDQKIADSIKLPADNVMNLGLQGVDVSIQSLASRIVNRATVNQYYINQVMTLDKEKKGFVTMEEIDKAGTRYRYYRSLAVAADANNDQKVTPKELASFMSLMGQSASCVSTISFIDQGRGFFQMIDSSGDGRISGRELKSASKVLMAHDKNKDGKLDESEIPQQFQLTLNPGGQPNYPRPGTTNTTSSRKTGPAWFHKMDRNGDGDISRSEFLGSPKHFKDVDLDNDDYISLEEAEKAEERYRSRK